MMAFGRLLRSIASEGIVNIITTSIDIINHH